MIPVTMIKNGSEWKGFEKLLIYFVDNVRRSTKFIGENNKSIKAKYSNNYIEMSKLFSDTVEA